MKDLNQLPPDLPRPVDDGAAAHLIGHALPALSLHSTQGGYVDLAAYTGRIVVFAYPRTGRPGEKSLNPGWDQIPGARGCTPEACSYRDLAAEFARRDVHVFGLSTQDPAYQQEMATRLELPYPVLSDAELTLTRVLRLPTMEVAGQTLLKRLTFVADKGLIEHVFYPVFPPDENAAQVIAWLTANARR